MELPLLVRDTNSSTRSGGLIPSANVASMLMSRLCHHTTSDSIIQANILRSSTGRHLTIGRYFSFFLFSLFLFNIVSYFSSSSPSSSS